MATQDNPKILLKNGTLLMHDEKYHVLPTMADLLVEGSIIAKIGKDINADSETKVIDCKGKIISPGFVDTHRHLYQTQMKGKHANHTLLEYFPSGQFIANLYSTEDLFWGELAGALESIDVGTTTVVDHSSCNPSSDHPPTAIQALLTSGLRSVYCYSPPRRNFSSDPWNFDDDYLSDETRTTFQELALAAPFGNGKVHVGFAVDNLYMPAEIMKPYYADLRDPAKGKAKIITSHGLNGPMAGNGPSAIQMLAKHDLLGPDILISHANYPREGDTELYKKSGTHLSCTPSTEMQMGWPPMGLREDHYENASLGIDCHSWTNASIPTQMNLLLQYARVKRGMELADQGLWSRHTGSAVEQVFNLGTVSGAKAAGLEDEVGRIKVGMKADLVVFDSESPSMLAAALEDPVAAIVLHASVRDVEMVLVDGIIRKEKGRLKDVTIAKPLDGEKGVLEIGKVLAWEDVVRSLLESRNALNKRMEGIDMKGGEEYAIDEFHLDRSMMLETQQA